MDAEFTLTLKEKNADNAISALQKTYKGHNLEETYKQTRLNNVVQMKNFSFGFTGRDVHMLASLINNDLKIYLENTVNPNDFRQLQSRMNTCYNEVVKGLKKQGISVQTSRAIVTTDYYQFPGKMNSWREEIIKDFKDKKDKFFAEPITALIISFFALKFGFVTVEDYDKDVVKTFIGVAEVYSGFVIVYFGKFLIWKVEKKFKFDIEL